MAWSLVWNVVIHESPETHPTITEEERQLIASGRPPRDLIKKDKPVRAFIFFFFIDLFKEVWVGGKLFCKMADILRRGILLCAETATVVALGGMLQ